LDDGGPLENIFLCRLPDLYPLRSLLLVKTLFVKKDFKKSDFMMKGYIVQQKGGCIRRNAFIRQDNLLKAEVGAAKGL